MRTLSKARHLIGLAMLIGITTAGCAGQSPTAPSVPAATPSPAPTPQALGTLTIRVLSRTAEEPIAGATIATTTTRIATDATGVGRLEVIPGQEVDVEVSAAGYDTMGASAVVGAAERWTFYLPATGASLTQPAAAN